MSDVNKNDDRSIPSIARGPSGLGSEDTNLSTKEDNQKIASAMAILRNIMPNANQAELEDAYKNVEDYARVVLRMYERRWREAHAETAELAARLPCHEDVVAQKATPLQTCLPRSQSVRRY